MTFKDYLGRQRPRFDAKGDFVRLATRDMPDVTSWRELESYMHGQGLSFNATEAGRALWLEYAAAEGKRKVLPSAAR